ncbi:extracellular solute-binding protein [Jiella sp. MQZ9-1]|uniref:Extracellular solute-binding protein n=1 Tax=Jiella flava TaxID=2816857 RepID=A0A939G356_9HYPH|nr:extracellular solute-binding protein [Jiella flava]MBO0664214.1 extracellular solute-binding protein [Jiella flava]MCD2472860.1 extracellular solute-binding protein [Jiella flava]
MFRKIAILATALLTALPASAEEIHLKMWTLVDRDTPYREQNIVDAAKVLNAEYKAAGIDKTIVIDVNRGNQKGWDAYALDMLKAFAVKQGPDIYTLPHEWIGKFAENGYAMNMEAAIAARPWAFNDVLPNLWESVRASDGKIHGVPQDAEIRMFFYNKDMLRKIGKDEAFIDGLPAAVERGDFTLDDLTALAKEVKDKGAAEYGMLHRPNVGIDYLMVFKSFGVKFVDPKTGKLMLPKKEMQNALAWYETNAKEGVTPIDNTAMSWDAIKTAFKQEKAFIFHQGVWAVAWQTGDALGVSWPKDEAGYTHKIGWLPAPAAVKGGKPANLSHPIIYAINPGTKYPDVAADLVAIATTPYFNVRHAVISNHTAITHAETALPAYKANWVVSLASPMMEGADFVPNNPQFSDYNKVLFTGLQAVETGKMTAAQAVGFIADELDLQLGDAVEIHDSAAE